VDRRKKFQKIRGERKNEKRKKPIGVGSFKSCKGKVRKEDFFCGNGRTGEKPLYQCEQKKEIE